MKNEGTSEGARNLKPQVKQTEPLRQSEQSDADNARIRSVTVLDSGQAGRSNSEARSEENALDRVSRLRKEAHMSNAGVLTDVSIDNVETANQEQRGNSTSQAESAMEVVSRLRKEAHMSNAGVLTDVSAGMTGGLPLPRQQEARPQPANFDVAKVNPVTRALEIVIALTALTLTLPIQLILGLIIWRGTPGPVLFRQQRLGVNAENFTFVKFRTFYADARERFPELYAYDYSKEEMETLRFKVEKDPRVSPQGEWMRKTSLDELPNFWNLLTGDMALVGPRPEIPEMLPYYKGEMMKKFAVRPGITGLAQTSGRGHLSFKDTVALDLEYVEKRSFWFDIKILFNTFVMVALHKGAY